MRKKKEHDDQEPQVQSPPEQEAPAEAPGGSEPEAPAPPQATTEAAMAALRDERDDLLSRLQRVSADYLNYQKRVQRDVEAARQFANEELIKSLLTVLDDMERALAAARNSHDQDDPFLKGMELVHDKALETLGRFGLKTIEAEGRPFDPALHSAMMQQPSAEHPPQTVLTEVIRGYRLKGRTIRPSGVIVSVAPEADQAQPPPAEGEAPRGTDEDQETQEPQ